MVRLARLIRWAIVASGSLGLLLHPLELADPLPGTGGVVEVAPTVVEHDPGPLRVQAHRGLADQTVQERIEIEPVQDRGGERPHGNKKKCLHLHSQQQVRLPPNPRRDARRRQAYLGILQLSRAVGR